MPPMKVTGLHRACDHKCLTRRHSNPDHRYWKHPKGASDDLTVVLFGHVGKTSCVVEEFTFETHFSSHIYFWGCYFVLPTRIQTPQSSTVEIRAYHTILISVDNTWIDFFH